MLKGNAVAAEGTVYIGDGAFGRPARTVDATPRWYTEKAVAVTHFWVIDVSRDGLQFTAIDQAGAAVDAFALP